MTKSDYIEKDKNINSENINDFSIIEDKGKEIILITLKSGESIELSISTNIKELFDILNLDKENYIKTSILNLIDRATKEIKKQSEQADFDFENWLELPDNVEKKELYNKDPDKLTIKELIEKWRISNKFFETYKEGKNNLLSDFRKLSEISRLLKIMEANEIGLLQPTQKQIGLDDKNIGDYGRNDIINKERISNYLPILEKLFKAFQRATFSKDDPRSYHELNDDEKRLLSYKLSQPIGDPKAKDDEEENNINQIVPYEKNEQLKQIGIKEEIDKLFGYGIVERGFEQFYAYKEDTELSKGSSEILEISHKIYKKLVILGLYYKNELYIKTASGTEIFTGSEYTNNSIDGKIYYKDHQEKYGGDKRYRFIMDNYGQKKDIYIPIVDLKISDLSYGSMSDTIGLLSEKGIAPTFSIILSNGLLPGLGEFKPKDKFQKDNISINDKKHPE